MPSGFRRAFLFASIRTVGADGPARSPRGPRHFLHRWRGYVASGQVRKAALVVEGVPLAGRIRTERSDGDGAAGNLAGVAQADKGAAGLGRGDVDPLESHTADRGFRQADDEA